MLKLTPREFDREPRDVLPFPADAVRQIGWSHHAGRPDPGACDAARRVEAAMAEVERRFGRLRLILTDDGDDDRPRAA